MGLVVGLPYPASLSLSFVGIGKKNTIFLEKC
jgi:hypothetical protein